MLSIQIESFIDRLHELKPLLPEHWKELALDQEKVDLEPMYERYFEMESADQLMFVTVREDARLLGYFVGIVGPSLHYRHCLTLTMDVFWLHPELRDGDSLDAVDADMICMDLFEKVIKEAKRRGVKRCIFGSKLHKDSARLFEALGMTEIERYFSKWIGA